MSLAGYLLQLWPSRLYAVPVALFTLLWLRFLWRWYALLLLGSGLSAAHNPRGFFILFGLPFLFAGLSLIATSARLCFGRTVIALDGLRLTVHDGLGPRALPWAPPQVLPTVAIRDFVAETSAALDPVDHEDDREPFAWQVCARLHEGGSVILPLPVRSLAEADDVASRLNRALVAVRAPLGYRDGVATASSDGKETPLGSSMM